MNPSKTIAETAHNDRYADPENPVLPASTFNWDIRRTAMVVIDPQVDFMSPEGAAWAVVGESVTEQNLVSHLLQLFAATKAAAGALLAFTSVVDLARGSEIAHTAVIPDTPEDFKSIKILAFDFQGSCMDYYQPIAEMGQVINKNKGLSLDWSYLTKEWIMNLYKVVGERREDYLPAAQLYRVALDRMLAQQNLSSMFSNAERDEMMGVWDRMVPWPDTTEGLARLKRKFALTTLSNASMASVFQSVRRHALPFDQVLTGELVQAYKPAPQVYNLVTSLLGYKIDEVLFCATHFADLKEAKKFGYKTAWWPRPNETGPDQVTDMTPKPFVDIHARDIIDLAKKLGA